MSEDGGCARRQVARRNRGCEHPVKILAQDEGEPSGAVRRPGSPRTRLVPGRRAGPQPAPRERPRETEALQIARIVASDAGGEDVRLPGARGKLEPLELTDHLVETVAPMELRAGVHVLPAKEEAHQVGDGHRLDLAPETTERQPVDASE